MRFYTLFAAICLAVASLAQQPSGTLPVMHINTVGYQPVASKDYYVDATYYIDTMGCTEFEPIGSAENPLDLQIKGRGNYTWTAFAKKPYRIKLAKKADLLGLGSNRHFALLAHADDNYGFLRNPTGFFLSKELGMPWTPGEQPVEVMLNNKYIGLYFLTETIRVDKNRVNVVEQPDFATDPDEITGGWLVEIDNYYDDPHIIIKEGDGYDIVVTYKSPEQLSPQQADYLTSQISTINQRVYSSDTSVCQWADNVDLATLARFYVVQEIMDNYESFHGSCYMYKQRGDDQRWQFGPVWDFGSAFNYDKSQYVYQGREHHMTWIEHMCRFPAFINEVKKVWLDFCENGYAPMLDFVDAYASRIAQAARADAQVWPQYGNADELQRAAKVKQRLRKSCQWLAQQWGGTLNDPDITPITLYYINDAPTHWQQVYAYSWDNCPDGTFYELFGRWPGSPMQPTTINGVDAYVITATPTHVLSDHPGLIFDNGHSGSGNQTADLTLHNGHIYHYDGSHHDGIEAVACDSQPLQIRRNGASIVITAPANRQIQVSTPSGISFIFTLHQGDNTLPLPPGIYIIDHQKYAL